MLNTRIDVMRAVASPLIQSEKHIDAAIAELTTAMAAAVAGRAKAKLPLDAGAAGLAQAAAALQQIIAGRASLAAAHLDFADVKDRMGLSRVPSSEDSGYGDTGNTPREFMADAQDAPRISVLRAA